MIVGIVVAVALAAAIAVGAIFLFRDDPTSDTPTDPGTSQQSDEEQIRAVVNSLTEAYNTDDFDAYKAVTCEDNPNVLQESEFDQNMDDSGGGIDVTVYSVDVDGDEATAKVREESANGDFYTGDYQFVREDGDWKYCPEV